ncbi:protein lethal(2)essential for life-like [Leptidea sinapis]|uniref:protein lethal(2)essential for life-like n=1 Tax=Leptidea sinapis TaxID=189913 RepID=UPI0021C2E8F9|nr:protein lethal(2)essential for life-like [Leptidea sinapis]
MYKAIIFAAILTLTTCEEKPYKTHHYVDPFALLDRHLSHNLAYLWPWSHLIRAAAALDLEESLEEPQIISDSEKYMVRLNVRHFKPEELKIKVKNRYMIVEGKHKDKEDDKRFIGNHFMQRFVLSPGVKQEEIKAVLNEKGILSISAPKHELPPPPPEIEVPIEVIKPEHNKEVEKLGNKPQDKNQTEDTDNNKDIFTAPVTPIDQIETEATTHIGKIRKKELKTTTKTTNDNEVTKGGDGNGLDYALIEAEE